MRKLLIVLAAVALVAAFTVPATAFESEFGGYWRTRAYSQSDFDGAGTEAQDVTQVDTRTRLYYTAKFSDDFKFVNKFEWNSNWGDTTGGDIGTDGTGILRIKHSYVDFNLQAFNFKIGAQGTVLARGFLFDDDHMGAVVTYKGEAFQVPFIWIKAYEGGVGKDANDFDVDYYALAPSFKLGVLSLKPYVMYITSDDVRDWAGVVAPAEIELTLTYIGVDLDAKIGPASLWVTAISESGDGEMLGVSVDVSATLFAFGASMPLGPASLHAQLLYASGDDNAADLDEEAFFVPAGDCYYWAEIMGYGIFDNQLSADTPGSDISNLMAYNIGVSFKPTDKLTVGVDLWNATLNEVAAGDPDDLGTEIDLVLTYKLMDNMNLDVVAAQLSAGDATGGGKEDPTEFGTRLSISF